MTEPIAIWGTRPGYCCTCSEFVDDEPIWKYENGFRFAYCLECAIDNGIISL